MTLDQLLNAVSSLGTLGFALIMIYALIKPKPLLVPKERLDELWQLFLQERTEKKEALELAKASVAAQERLSDAVEERNRLEAAREQAQREVRR